MEFIKLDICKSDIDKNVKNIVDTIMTALYSENDTLPFLNRVFKVFPELKNEIYSGLTYEDIYTKVYYVMKEHFKNEDEEIQLKINHFNEISNSTLIEAIKEVASIFNVKYECTQNFLCLLGFFNPFPRDVITKEYCIHYDVSDEVFLRSSLHEINHMIFFDKWKQMHGYSKDKQPLYPDTLWYLEELIIEPTLNDSRIQDIIPIKHNAYESFQKIIIDGKPLPKQIQIIYVNSNCIEEFLDKSYNYIENYKNIIL